MNEPIELREPWPNCHEETEDLFGDYFWPATSEEEAADEDAFERNGETDDLYPEDL